MLGLFRLLAWLLGSAVKVLVLGRQFRAIPQATRTRTEPEMILSAGRLHAIFSSVVIVTLLCQVHLSCHDCAAAIHTA